MQVHVMRPNLQKVPGALGTAEPVQNRFFNVCLQLKASELHIRSLGALAVERNM